MKGTQEQKVSSLGIHYLLYLPADYSQGKKLPLMLFLHGSGERGKNLELLKKYGPPKVVETKMDLPFIIVSPQCPKGSYWKAELLMALLDEVIKETAADQERIYATGVSMGGYGTWDLATTYPEKFAAIIPICGGGVEESAGKIKHLPVWTFHGAKDNIVPLATTQAMVNELNRIGGNVMFTIYPDAAHDSWTETYDNDKVYEWLLKQRRSS